MYLIQRPINGVRGYSGTAREQHTAVEFEDQIFYFGGNNENGFAIPFDVYKIPKTQQTIRRNQKIRYQLVATKLV